MATERLRSATLGRGARPALLVVDASRGFTDPQSPLGADYSAEIANIIRLMLAARDAGWPCFLSTVCYRSDDQAPVFRRKLPDLNLLRPESAWVKIDQRLPRRDSDRVFEKHYASCFFRTSLAEELSAHRVDTLLVTGFTTSGCVRASAVDGLQHDLRVQVVTDAVGDRDAAAHQANLRDLGLKYADLVTTADLLA